MAIDHLQGAKAQLAAQIESGSVVAGRPIPADPWVVSSLLQKSIRRGETEIAQRAAFTLYGQRGSAIWRRLLVVAFEDVGIGDVNAVLATVAVASDSAWRKSHGGDLPLAIHIAGILAASPKDRSADHLAGAKDHPEFADFARAMSTTTMDARLALVGDRAAPLPKRAIAAVLSSGMASEAKGQTSTGDGEALLAAFREMGVPAELVTAASIAAAKTREPITLMVPLIWLAAKGLRTASVQDCGVPSLVYANDLPLYALDEHTRLGREAIWRFARQSAPVSACLERFVPEDQRRRAANVAAFYADAAPVARRLVWDQSDDLEAFGTERDLLVAGVPRQGITPLLEAVRTNLGHLNDARAAVLTKSRLRTGHHP